MPAHHRAYAECSPERCENLARKVRPETGRLIAAILARYPHPALGYRFCLGILRLEERPGAFRLDKAAAAPLPSAGRATRA